MFLIFKKYIFFKSVKQPLLEQEFSPLLEHLSSSQGLGFILLFLSYMYQCSVFMNCMSMSFYPISVISWPSVYGGYPTFDYISVISRPSVYGGYLTFNHISDISWPSVYGRYPTFNNILVISLVHLESNYARVSQLSTKSYHLVTADKFSTSPKQESKQ